jgi:hypothetical protein
MLVKQDNLVEVTIVNNMLISSTSYILQPHISFCIKGPFTPSGNSVIS